MSTMVYISVGRDGSPKQEAFVQAVERYVQSQGLIPRTVGRNYFKNAQPLKSVADCMQECSGVIVIGFERLRIEKGIERRGSPKEILISDSSIPTVWNHIEAAMGYVLRRPLLLLVESSLKQEGMLTIGNDSYVQYVEIDEKALATPEFTGVFSDWKELCLKDDTTSSRPNHNVDPDRMTWWELIKSLKPAQLWAAVAALFSIFGIIATAAFKLGGLFHH